MTPAPRNRGENQDVEPFCYILHLFKQTECVEIGKLERYNILQIQKEDTE